MLFLYFRIFLFFIWGSLFAHTWDPHLTGATTLGLGGPGNNSNYKVGLRSSKSPISSQEALLWKSFEWRELITTQEEEFTVKRQL